MYLIILDRNAVGAFSELTSSRIAAADDGEVGIVDISDPSNPRKYSNGRWYSINTPTTSERVITAHEQEGSKPLCPPSLMERKDFRTWCLLGASVSMFIFAAWLGGTTASWIAQCS